MTIVVMEKYFIVSPNPLDLVKVVVVSDNQESFMNWIFIVCRDCSIEQVKVFKDFWEGANYTDNFIKRIEPGIEMLPVYNRGENYRNGNLIVGLYKDI